jgi:hypothetical protein
VRWLALFFRSLLSLFLYGVFQQALDRSNYNPVYIYEIMYVIILILGKQRGRA